MKKNASLHVQYEPYFIAGVLAAHFSYQNTGFRQKDVRFMIELFSNWMDAMIGDVSLPVQNVQIQRYLDALTDESCVKRLKANKGPRYELTRQGLAKLIARLVGRQSFLPLDQVFFVYYFLKSYGKLFDDLVSSNLISLTPSLKAELSALREPELVLQNQIRFLQKESRKIAGRIEEARAAADLGEGTLKSGGSLDEAIEKIQRKFPYELSSRRPLPELMRDIPDPLRQWEMTDGLRFRAQVLWTPLLAYLRQTEQVLSELVRGAKS